MSNDIKADVPRYRRLRVLNPPQADLVQGLLLQIPFKISLNDGGHDGLSAMTWIEDALDEAFLDYPKVFKLKIFLREAERRASRDPEIAEKIRSIIEYLGE